jgi:hypothetical protein
LFSLQYIQQIGIIADFLEGLVRLRDPKHNLQTPVRLREPKHNLQTPVRLREPKHNLQILFI